jgi:hypothetical protein
MGRRKISIVESATQSIAQAAWYIESLGMLSTADRFSDEVYDFIFGLSDNTIVHSLCREPSRNLMGYKCRIFKKKYTIVFFEDDENLTVYEFIPSRLIKW